MHDLSRFGVADMAECTRVVDALGKSAGSMEECAGEIVRYLYKSLKHAEVEGSACALVRFFKTHDLSGLAPELQPVAEGALGGADAQPQMKCFVLLGTAGEQEAWNRRESSAGHQVIPLLSPRAVEKMPMISQLVKELGFSVSEVVQTNPDLVIDLEARKSGVFFIPEALDSPYIPAQDEFVKPHGIRSVLGFGGAFPSGNLFATILFSKAPIPRRTAEMFGILAVSVKAALMRFDWGPTFRTSAQ